MTLFARHRAEAQQTLGEPPQLATIESRDSTADPGSAVQLNGRRSSSTHGRYGMNLPAVAEVLARYGIDPAEELAKVLTAKPDPNDPNPPPGLSINDKAKLLTELMQYTRPKLKATEITVKPPELTDEQIELRLQRLMGQK